MAIIDFLPGTRRSEDLVCGRAYRKSPSPKLAQLFHAIDRFDVDQPEFNIAPTQDIPAVRLAATGGERELVGLYWGPIPPWAKDEGKRPFQVTNAKSETVHEKPMFKSAFEKRRCLVLFDGFYEWKREPIAGKKKTLKRPFLFTRPDAAPLVLAGLYQPNKTFALQTAAVLTCAANPVMAPVHHRMPCLLDAEQQALWLDPDAPTPALLDILAPAPDDAIVATEVSDYVNNARHQGAECIAPLHAAASKN